MNAELLYDLGMAYWRASQPGRARQVLLEAIRKQEDAVLPRILLARVLLQFNELQALDVQLKRLKELAPDLNLAIENHVLDRDDFERWADRNPGLTLDVEHLWKYTLHDASLATLLNHVDRFLEQHAHKLHHVHLPGYQPGGEEHHPIHDNEEMATQVMTRLAEHGFTKLVVSELDAPFQTHEYLRQDVMLFERWVKSSTAKQ